MRDQEKVEFFPPQGASNPEGPEGSKGGRFSLVCDFEPRPDGKVCMVQYGDQAMPGYDGKEGMNAEKPSYGGYVGSMKSQGYPNA